MSKKSFTPNDIEIGKTYCHPHYSGTRYQGEYDGRVKLLRITRCDMGFLGKVVATPEEMTKERCTMPEALAWWGKFRLA